jgi:hypothetical protein
MNSETNPTSEGATLFGAVAAFGFVVAATVAANRQQARQTNVDTNARTSLTNKVYDKRGPYVYKPPAQVKPAIPSVDSVAKAAIPQPTILENVSINSVALHKLVSLRDSFPSANSPNVKNSHATYNQVQIL